MKEMTYEEKGRRVLEKTKERLKNKVKDRDDNVHIPQSYGEGFMDACRWILDDIDFWEENILRIV